MQIGIDMASYRYLMNANIISEWMWTIYVKLMLLIVFSSATFAVLSVVICLLMYDSIETEYLYHPFYVLLVSSNFLNFQKSTVII